MRLVPDVSYWQSGGGAANALDVAGLASAVPACFVRMGDYVEFHAYGPDRHYVDTVEGLVADGCRASGYLYPRPTLDDPVTQIDNWFNASPPFTMAPMLDPEGPGTGGMSGATLSQWIDEALARMRFRWPRWDPVWYTSAAFCSGYGVTRPTTPHLLQLAEYHFGYQPFGWGAFDWVAHALSAYGGPDLPPGYAGWDLWQFTSSAAGVPGTSGNLDMSMVHDDAWDRLTGGAAPAPAKEDDDVIKQFQTPDGTVWMVWGIFRAAMTDDNLRHALMELELLDPELRPLEHAWTLSQLREVPPDFFRPASAKARAAHPSAQPTTANPTTVVPVRKPKLPGSTNAGGPRDPDAA